MKISIFRTYYTGKWEINQGFLIPKSCFLAKISKKMRTQIRSQFNNISLIQS